MSNFCTWNPIDFSFVTGDNHILSNGNLTSSAQGDGTKNGIVGTIQVSSGKWYWEYSGKFGSNTAVGIHGGDAIGGATIQNWPSIGSGIAYEASTGNKNVDGSETSYGNSYTDGDVIGVALNMDDNEITFYKNGVSQGTISDSISPISRAEGRVRPALFQSNNISTANDHVVTANFGQFPFRYTPPADHLALSTENLAEPVTTPLSANQPEKFFNTVLWTGTGNQDEAITGVGFQPDWVWIKNRSSVTNHHVYDSVRGVGKRLRSNSAAAEDDYASSDPNSALQSFDSDGFTVGDFDGQNGDGDDMVAWCWKAGGAAVENTDGTITSQVSANTESGFSIVSYTGDGTTGTSTVGHGLSSAPDMVIVKNRDSGVAEWMVWTKELGSTENLELDDDGAAAINTNRIDDADSTLVDLVGNGGNKVNESGSDYIMYCFHSVEGFSSFGSYEGNGSTNGTFVYTGFRPAFILAKNADSISTAWQMWDNKRDIDNPSNSVITSNGQDAEQTTSAIDILGNGFKVRNDGASTNTDGDKNIYMAFAEMPKKYSRAK